MFTRKKTDAESVIEDLMEFCVKHEIKDAYAFGKLDPSRYQDLLIAVADAEGLECYMEVCHIAYDLHRLRFRSDSREDVVEDLIKNYCESLDNIPQLIQIINNKIEVAWMDYYDDNPCAKPKSDVLYLIEDDNRERARSLRGI